MTNRFKSDSHRGHQWRRTGGEAEQGVTAMTGDEFKAAHVARYQADQAQDREAIAWINAGGRHYDQASGATGLVESTKKIRSERQAPIEMFEDLIRMWSRHKTLDIRSGNGSSNGL